MKVLENCQFKFEILTQQELIKYLPTIQKFLIQKQSNLIYPNSQSFTNYIVKDRTTDKILSIFEGIIIPPLAIIYTIISFHNLLLYYKQLIDFFKLKDIYIFNFNPDTDKIFRYLKWDLYFDNPDFKIWHKRWE